MEPKENIEQPALLPIDPKREAYAQATRILREYQYDQKLRIRYKAFPGQVEDVVNCFNEIIYKLEDEITEIDRTSK